MKKEKVKKRGLLKRFFAYYRPHRKLFIIDMICAFVISVFNLVYPYLTKEIINNYVPNKLLDLLLAASGILLVIFVIKAALNYVLQYWGHLVGVEYRRICARNSFLISKNFRFPISTTIKRA